MQRLDPLTPDCREFPCRVAFDGVADERRVASVFQVEPVLGS